MKYKETDTCQVLLQICPKQRIDSFLPVDKRNLRTEFQHAGNIWGTFDPVTKTWKGMVERVSY